MRPGLTAGDRAEFSRKVPEAETVSRLFPDSALLSQMPDVLATAYMIGMMEWACCEQIAPYYEADEVSLGTHVDVSHSAPTPPGLTVTVRSEIESIDDRFVWFRVSAHDGQSLIGEGRHQRALVKKDRFSARAAAKISATEVA